MGIQLITALIKSNGIFDNRSRFALLRKIIKHEDVKCGIILFPGGFFTYEKFADRQLESLNSRIVAIDELKEKELVICLGIDAAEQADQFSFAFNHKGVLAVGRKFYPAPREKKYLNKAASIYEKEYGFRRTFKKGRNRFFLAVCYDSFGIKHEKLKNEGVTVILNNIHKFNPKPKRGSGESYFARHGLAGAAKQWNCQVFGSVVFYKRDIPPKWPSGVSWNKGKMTTQKWKYTDNPLKPVKIEIVTTKDEYAELRFFEIRKKE